MGDVEIYTGDCLKVMKDFPDNHIDTVITDPPYGLSFMGKDWDHGIPGVRFWAEILRVAKPGAMLLAFGGTRTFHRLTCAIEDAGWEIRDCLMWLYGSGFPKSLDISKTADKLDALERRQERALKFTAWMRENCPLSSAQANLVMGTEAEASHYFTAGEQPHVSTRKHFEKLRPHFSVSAPNWIEQMVEERTVESEDYKRREITGKHSAPAKSIYSQGDKKMNQDVNLTAPATDLAKKWSGWGTALKPAWEPIILAMKKIDGTYAENAKKYGVAGLNIDGGRIDGDMSTAHYGGVQLSDSNIFRKLAGKSYKTQEHSKGRFPANLILDEEAAKILDEQSGERPTGAVQPYQSNVRNRVAYGTYRGESNYEKEADSGGASRFFYVAKASRSEREAGLSEAVSSSGAEVTGRKPDSPGLDNPRSGMRRKGEVRNIHPTVKPIKLMEYLVRLTKTPTGGIVLDPFAGSGSTGIACVLNDRPFILIDKDPRYCKIAKARIEHWRKNRKEIQEELWT